MTFTAAIRGSECQRFQSVACTTIKKRPLLDTSKLSNIRLVFLSTFQHFPVFVIYSVLFFMH